MQAQIHLRTALIGRALATGVAALTLISLGVTLADRYGGPAAVVGQSHLRRLFDLGQELNFPTWFSSCLMFFCALLLAALAGRARVHRFQWGFLAVVFLALSADEVASVHEALSYVIHARRGLPGEAFTDWVAPVLGFALLVGLVCLPLLRSVDWRTRRLILLAAGLFLGGAAGLELLQGHLLESARGSLTLDLLYHLEEALEVAGVAIFAYALATLRATPAEPEPAAGEDGGGARSAPRTGAGTLL